MSFAGTHKEVQTRLVTCMASGIRAWPRSRSGQPGWISRRPGLSGCSPCCCQRAPQCIDSIPCRIKPFLCVGVCKAWYVVGTCACIHCANGRHYPRELPPASQPAGSAHGARHSAPHLAQPATYLCIHDCVLLPAPCDVPKRRLAVSECTRVMVLTSPWRVCAAGMHVDHRAAVHRSAPPRAPL